MARRDLEREERFARLVAIDGLTYVAAFCESAAGFPKPEPTPAARVQASRMAKRTADLRAEMSKAKADASAPLEVSTDTQSILKLMDSVSAALLQASKVAKAHGHDRLANTLRQSLTTHVGRHSRASARLDNPDAVTGGDDAAADALARRILEYQADDDAD